MTRNTLLLRLIAALVGVAAVAIAAATVSSPIEPGGTGGSGGGEGGGTGAPAPVDGASPGTLPPFLGYLIALIVIVAALAVAWYLIVHRRRLVKLIAITLAVALVVGVVLYGLFQITDFSFGPEGQEPLNASEPSGDPGQPGDPDGDRTDFDFGPLLWLLALITAIFVGSLVLGDRGEDPTPGTAATGAAESEEAAAVGAAAGRAADRIATGDGEAVENEVYRAWREMTRLLDVDSPETSTPGEFADAAVDAGMARGDVEELTRLFEDVRYGRAETTAERESQAVAVLRRIEAAYGDEADAGAGGDSS